MIPDAPLVRLAVAVAAVAAGAGAVLVVALLAAGVLG
jgi:hypothetical protein